MAKRASGEGSIHKRTDGRWAASYEVGWTDGKRVRKYVYGSTQREVQQKLQTVRRQIEQGMSPAPERDTVAKFLGEWLGAVESGLRPRTLHRYQTVVRVHLVPGLGKHRLSQLSPQQVEAFLARKTSSPRVRPGRGKAATPLSARTIQEIRTVLVTALNKAVRWGLVGRNVAALVNGPRVPHREIQPFTPEESRAFLRAVQGHRMEALYSVAIGMGLRQGEALALKWEDIDFDAGTLHVHRALQRISGEYVLVETKTAKSRRSLALPAMAMTALREHRIRQLEERLAAGPRWVDWGLVFCSPVGTPLGSWAVTHQFQRLLVHAGLRRQRFHDLRHACASLLLAQGVDLKVIQEQLGHSTIATTANIYSHVIDDLKRDAATRMDAIFAPSAQSG